MYLYIAFGSSNVDPQGAAPIFVQRLQSAPGPPRSFPFASAAIARFPTNNLFRVCAQPGDYRHREPHDAFCQETMSWKSANLRLRCHRIVRAAASSRFIPTVRAPIANGFSVVPHARSYFFSPIFFVFF